MRRLLLMTTIAVSGFAAPAEPPALMPMPLKLETGAGALAIDQRFTVAATLADARLEGALNRLVTRLSRQTGMAIPRGKPAAGRRATLRVECAARGPLYPTLGEDESYQLEVASEGALLKAATVDGALRGLETFAQLVVPGASGFEAPAVHIDDRPRFPWRGLMLDVSRHWMPVEVVERNLDAMAAVKLNVFHWHLSDDQGFRVESKLYPRLQQFGSGGHYYTQTEIRAVVAYARERGIRVVPEFDVPGHTVSWFPGYPRLACGPGPFEIGGDFGGYDPVMDPSREETYTSSMASSAKWRRCSPTPISTWAATKSTASSGASRRTSRRLPNSTAARTRATSSCISASGFARYWRARQNHGRLGRNPAAGIGIEHGDRDVARTKSRWPNRCSRVIGVSSRGATTWITSNRPAIITASRRWPATRSN